MGYKTNLALSTDCNLFVEFLLAYGYFFIVLPVQVLYLTQYVAFKNNSNVKISGFLLNLLIKGQDLWIPVTLRNVYLVSSERFSLIPFYTHNIYTAHYTHRPTKMILFQLHIIFPSAKISGEMRKFYSLTRKKLVFLRHY